MGLTLKRGRDGQVRRWWYLEFYRPDGRRTVVNLNVPIEGTPPASGRVTEKGDAAFERSKVRAMGAAEVVKADAKKGRRDRSAALRTYKEQTGSPLVAAPIGALRGVFDGEAKRSEKWRAFRRSAVARFADWLEERKVGTVLDVTITTAQLSYLLSGIDWRNPQETSRPTRVG